MRHRGNEAGEIRPVKPAKKSLQKGRRANLQSAASSEVCRVVKPPVERPDKREPSLAEMGEGQGSGAELGIQPRRTLRRKGRGMQGQSNEGTGEALLGRGASHGTVASKGPGPPASPPRGSRSRA